MRHVQILVLATFLSACGSSGTDNSGEASNVHLARVTKADFLKRGLTWPLTIDAGNISCRLEARTIEVSGVEYALNGTAKTQGYRDVIPIWQIDPKIADLAAKNGLANDPPMWLSIGDLIEEAGKLC